MYVCMYVCVYIYIYTHTYICRFITCTHRETQAQATYLQMLQSGPREAQIKPIKR